MSNDGEKPRKLIVTPAEYAEQVRQMKLASMARVAHLRRLYEANAEVQRSRMMTPEERARRAIDLMTQRLRAMNDLKQGRDTTEAEARAKAMTFAERSDKGDGVRKK